MDQLIACIFVLIAVVVGRTLVALAKAKTKAQRKAYRTKSRSATVIRERGRQTTEPAWNFFGRGVIPFNDVDRGRWDHLGKIAQKLNGNAIKAGMRHASYGIWGSLLVSIVLSYRNMDYAINLSDQAELTRFVGYVLMYWLFFAILGHFLFKRLITARLVPEYDRGYAIKRRLLSRYGSWCPNQVGNIEADRLPYVVLPPGME